MLGTLTASHRSLRGSRIASDLPRPATEGDDLVVLFSGQEARVTQFTVLNYNLSRDYDAPPPDTSARRNESVVSQGTLIVYKILEKKAAFLQCGAKFVHPILPKSRLWRCGVYEFVLPQPTPGRFWRIALIEPDTDNQGICEALDRLEVAFRTTCLYRNEYRPFTEEETNTESPVLPERSTTPTPFGVKLRKTKHKVNNHSGIRSSSEIISRKLSWSEDKPVAASPEIVRTPGKPSAPAINGFLSSDATTATTIENAQTSPELRSPCPSSATSSLDAILDSFDLKSPPNIVQPVGLFGTKSSQCSLYDSDSIHRGITNWRNEGLEDPFQADAPFTADARFQPDGQYMDSTASIHSKETDVTSNVTSPTEATYLSGDDMSSMVIYNSPRSPSTPFLSHPLVPLAQRNTILSSTYPLQFRPMDDDWLDVVSYGSGVPSSRYIPEQRGSYLTLASQLAGGLFSWDKLRTPSIISGGEFHRQQSHALDSLWPIYNNIGTRQQRVAVMSSHDDASIDSGSTLHMRTASSAYNVWGLISRLIPTWTS